MPTRVVRVRHRRVGRLVLGDRWAPRRLRVATLLIAALWMFRARIPRRPEAVSGAARAVLVYTTIVAIWGSAAAPLVGSDVIASAVVQHASLTMTAVAAVAVAATAWMGR